MTEEKAAEAVAEAEVRTREIQIPAEIDWDMLDKSKFFFLGAALFSAVSAGLYPIIVLKTRQQILISSDHHHRHRHLSSLRTAMHIIRTEGVRAFYRGFGTSLLGTVPARALYMAALEITKTHVAAAAATFGVPTPTAAAFASAAAGVTSAFAAQLVWTPVDVISQRLMVQGTNNPSKKDNIANCKYTNGIDACRKIIKSDGIKGLYRGFGISILTYGPSNAVWWASYNVAQRIIWGRVDVYLNNNNGARAAAPVVYTPDSKAVMAVQGLSAAMAGGVSALITMPLDTIKTRMQVLDGEENGGAGGARRAPTIGQTVRALVKEGGWGACYRGLGPRWASMSMSATTMITTYEFLKRVSTKNKEGVS